MGGLNVPDDTNPLCVMLIAPVWEGGGTGRDAITHR